MSVTDMDLDLDLDMDKVPRLSSKGLVINFYYFKNFYKWWRDNNYLLEGGTIIFNFIFLEVVGQ